MAMAAAAISAISGLIGSFAQASAMNAQADAQERIAEWNAKQKEIEANRRQAEGALRGDLQEREAESLAGKARASMAEIGVDTAQGSPLLLEQDLMSEGAFRSSIELASAHNEQRTLQESAKGERYEGKLRAAASRMQAQASILSSIGGLFGSLGKAFG